MFPYSVEDLLMFDRPSYFFHRPMLEKEGWFSLEKDGKLLLLLNTLGVAKDDISLDVKSVENNKQMISINGTTKNEQFDKDFSVNMNFIVSKPMQNLDWDVTNGFLTMEITFEEPVRPAVKITRK